MDREEGSECRSVLETVANLVAFSGAMMVLNSLPLGIVLGLQDYARNRDYWSLVFGATLAVSCAIFGAILFWVGLAIVARCWQVRTQNQR
jgi:hypothetical protein